MLCLVVNFFIPFVIHYSEDAEGMGVKDPVPEKKESIRKKIAKCIESSIKSQYRQNVNRKTENS